jgi:hypothetical protein
MKAMVSRITFRRYKDADHDDVWSVFADCTEQLGFQTGPWDDDFHAIPSDYLEPGDEFIVGEIDGRIVAFAGLQREDEDRAEIRRVGVHPMIR